MMGKGDYEDFRIALVDNDGVGKASQYQTFHAPRSGHTGHRGQRDDFFFK